MPAVFTVIGLVVSALLHSNVPVALVAVSVDVPSQLSTTVTPGADGTAFTNKVYVASAAAQGAPKGLSVVTVIVTVLPASPVAGV
jgi:hypothetical protein